jgi:hypothetical protein
MLLLFLAIISQTLKKEAVLPPPHWVTAEAVAIFIVRPVTTSDRMRFRILQVEMKIFVKRRLILPGEDEVANVLSADATRHMSRQSARQRPAAAAPRLTDRNAAELRLLTARHAERKLRPYIPATSVMTFAEYSHRLEQ